MNTRPNISFAIEYLAQFTIRPTDSCWVFLKHLLRYLKGTRTKDIVYGLQPNPTISSEDTSYIKGYTDADWAGDTNTRRSTSDYIFLSAEELIV